MTLDQVREIELALSRVRGASQLILAGWAKRAFSSIVPEEDGQAVYFVNRRGGSGEPAKLPAPNQSDLAVRVIGFELAAIHEFVSASAGRPTVLMRQDSDGELLTFLFTPRAEDAELFGISVQYILECRVKQHGKRELRAHYHRFWVALRYFNGILDT